ncbi:MAG: hypothetical protein HY554_11770 [Elusimicrobia bacterium]|nr:hypothetical protein [Elusimicrobiota bacterium]
MRRLGPLALAIVLTGATASAQGAPGGPKPYEAIYFDASGNVVDDPAKARSYSVADNVKGVSSLPRPMAAMSAAERRQLGLAPERTEAAPPSVDSALPPPKSGSEARYPPRAIEPAAIRPPAGGAAQAGGARDGRFAAAAPSFAPPNDPESAYLAPAVASQARALDLGGGAGRYRALSSLAQVAGRLASDGGAAGAAYDASLVLPAIDDSVRGANAWLGVEELVRW